MGPARPPCSPQLMGPPPSTLSGVAHTAQKHADTEPVLAVPLLSLTAFSPSGMLVSRALLSCSSHEGHYEGHSERSPERRPLPSAALQMQPCERGRPSFSRVALLPGGNGPQDRAAGGQDRSEFLSPPDRGLHRSLHLTATSDAANAFLPSVLVHERPSLFRDCPSESPSAGTRLHSHCV